MTRRQVPPSAFATELARQLLQELTAPYETAPAGDQVTIRTPQDVADLLGLRLALLDHEELWAVLLSTRNHVIGTHMVYRGTINTTPVRTAEILRHAITANAPAIVMVHNHPSGDPSPSEPDVITTRRLNEAATLLDIELLDHIIIGAAGAWTSMKEKHMGFP